jgi:two-component system, OmpR family, alkaline phosphatase synthesis response regulator PhoP
MKPRRLLLVEDEAGLVLTLTDRFRREGYLVEHAGDGPTGLARATAEPFDLVLLDVMLPHLDGFEVCRQLRQRGVDVPIIMLTARGHVADRVSGLKLGADDYVTKPFEMVELLARVEARLRRAGTMTADGQTAFRFADVEVDTRRAEVRKGGITIELSAREFRLLAYLLAHRGATVSREELLRHVWGYDATPLTRTVDVHIAWLRQKLETNPRRPEWILTVHGLGYKLAGA